MRETESNMLLKHLFDSSEVNLALEVFLREAVDCLGDNLLSVIIYGSLVFDDLAPGYGDLDFLAVVRDDIPESMFQPMSDLRKPLRSGELGLIATMIEGEFVPRKSLAHPEIGQSYYWGTSSDKPRVGSSVAGLVAEVLHELGVVIYGADVRSEIPRPTREQLIADLRHHAPGFREYAKGGGLHAVDGLLTIARMIVFLREGRLSSKSEAAEWAFANAKGAWREYLPMAKQVRMNSWMANLAETRRWLDELDVPTNQACDELEAELHGSN